MSSICCFREKPSRQIRSFGENGSQVTIQTDRRYGETQNTIITIARLKNHSNDPISYQTEGLRVYSNTGLTNSLYESIEIDVSIPPSARSVCMKGIIEMMRHYGSKMALVAAGFFAGYCAKNAL